MMWSQEITLTQSIYMLKMTKFWAYLLLLLGATGSIASLIRVASAKSLAPNVT